MPGLGWGVRVPSPPPGTSEGQGSTGLPGALCFLLSPFQMRRWVLTPTGRLSVRELGGPVQSPGRGPWKQEEDLWNLRT